MGLLGPSKTWNQKFKKSKLSRWFRKWVDYVHPCLSLDDTIARKALFKKHPSKRVFKNHLHEILRQPSSKPTFKPQLTSQSSLENIKNHLHEILGQPSSKPAFKPQFKNTNQTYMSFYKAFEGPVWSF